jgi:hypothetical protein
MLSLCVALAALATVAPGSNSMELPSPIQKYLSTKYRGWKMAPVARQVTQWFRDDGFSHEPNLIKADFDDDGKMDYAIQIFNNKRNNNNVLIAFLARAGRFEPHVLATYPADKFTYIVLYKKGTVEFDSKALNSFTYGSDAIGLMYSTRTPCTFLYQNGQFRKFLDQDEQNGDQ